MIQAITVKRAHAWAVPVSRLLNSVKLVRYRESLGAAGSSD